MTDRELMQIALLSLVGSKTLNNKEIQEAINLLLEKLAQPEPVANEQAVKEKNT